MKWGQQILYGLLGKNNEMITGNGIFAMDDKENYIKYMEIHQEMREAVAGAPIIGQAILCLIGCWWVISMYLDSIKTDNCASLKIIKMGNKYITS